MLDNRAGVLRSYCICLMSAGDKSRAAWKLHFQQVRSSSDMNSPQQESLLEEFVRKKTKEQQHTH